MYIRTKDGVYEATDILEDGSCWCLNNGGKYFRKSDIINQSENLDELCDMTIVVDDERPDSVFELEWYIDEDLINKYKDVKGVYVYGAIWTDKGLIYVAKMNESGELELI